MVRRGPDVTVVTLVVCLFVHGHLLCPAVHGPVQVLQVVRPDDGWYALVGQWDIRKFIEARVSWYIYLVCYLSIK